MPFAARPEFDWRLRTRSFRLGRRTLVMGILNVTPDSFSDGGHFYSPTDAPDRAITHALNMLDEGADILDIGGESTRPGAIPLTPEEEQSRILPVIEALASQRPQAILSVDTFHAATARRAIEAGADIVNDVSGHQWDPAMAETCAATGCGVVLMHTRGRPQDWRNQAPLAEDEVVPLVVDGLKQCLKSALLAGIERDKIVLDPGFGFGKRLGENYPLLARLDELRSLNLPILAGVSRKSFLASAVAQNIDVAPESLTSADRLNATTAANTAAILAGAHILRVHDVRPALEAAAVADRILSAI
ncbi:dihydropteroate synthase [Edaphobacter acidisoli]|uniref:Dihydropteroate synthase n=1 Tax=Edaphobacter acidisoli TaxID=2040573 RepID=A0A916RV02_9BACT|nr:dihydropteroate synthase [Edaphobacter acidisoli]GGA72362.1 dihydropteroate synthase [Edaphobacter acidisoli]